MGSASPAFDPAVNPSRDIATSSTTLLIASLLRSVGAAVRRRHEKVGAGPAVLTSPRQQREGARTDLEDLPGPQHEHQPALRSPLL
jgi:hypothetical protein